LYPFFVLKNKKIKNCLIVKYMQKNKYLFK